MSPLSIPSKLNLSKDNIKGGGAITEETTIQHNTELVEKSSHTIQAMAVRHLKEEGSKSTFAIKKEQTSIPKEGQ